MKLIRLENTKEVDALAGDEFLQSWFWSEMAKKNGEVVARFAVSENQKILASISLIKKPLFGPYFYWYAPRGPRGEKTAAEFLLRELKKLKSGAIFLRIEPETKLAGRDLSGNGTKAKLEFKKSVDLQPAKTLILDLTKNTEELLGGMHQKTRYNINLAKKKGVEIIEGFGSTIASETEAKQSFSEFWRLMSLTGERDGFRLHTASHYQNLINTTDHIKLFFARYAGKNIATGLFCFFGDRVTYLHGASDNEARNLMAPYLLQWEVIKQAQIKAYKYYDFYGIDAKKWPGVTRFKLGFGGFIKEYPGTYDIIFRPLVYGFYEFLRKLRRCFK
jgi:lipid II:glycine glycyltransferase (peptidoglycan interpeptide bridge formation enzyme)